MTDCQIHLMNFPKKQKFGKINFNEINNTENEFNAVIYMKSNIIFQEIKYKTNSEAYLEPRRTPTI